MFFSQSPAKEESEGPFARGLKNIGNTCFLNSVLQAISSCPPFVRYLTELDPHRDIPFTLGLQNCLKGLRVNKVDSPYLRSWRDTAITKPVDTSVIFDMIVAYNSNFNGHDQQDAQELLQTVFAMIARDTEKRRNRPVNKALSLGNIVSENPKRTIPDNPFEGWITSDLVCQSCDKHRPLKHQVFTDISLPFESINSPINTTKKQNLHPSSSTSKSSVYLQAEIASNVRNESCGPLIGGLSVNNNRTNNPLIGSGPGLNLQDCLGAFMKEEELQQDVECQTCSWAETLKSFERKSNSSINDLSGGTGSKFTGQQEEQTLNELILQQFKTAMPQGALDSCSLDLDDVLFSTTSDADDTSSIADTMSITHSVRSCNSNIYSNWRMRNCLGAVANPQEKSTRLDPYLVQKVRTRTRKQLILSRPPPLLCLHICRRVADAVTGRMKKLNHHVAFPGVLDINDYVNTFRCHEGKDSKVKGPIGGSVGGLGGPGGPLGGVLNGMGVHGMGKRVGSGPNEYLLRSVIVHTGSSEAGHYSTYCLMSDPPSPKKWMYFSDEQVKPVREEDVLRSQAYMLFYERSGAYFKKA